MVVATNTLVVTYAGGGSVTINHNSPPTANIAELEDAIAAALASKWNEVLHTIAADEKSVRHPFVEAGIDKHGIRAIAATFGLGDIADLPAQPCLASRVETGLPILADQLELIDGIERQISDAIGPGDIRARMTRDGIRVEVPETQLAAAQALTETLETRIKGQGHRFAGITPYKRGSAFLRDQT